MKKPEAMLQELESACDELSVKVSYETFSASVGHGGLCRVKGQYRIIVDKRATPQERVMTLAQALAEIGGSLDSLSPRVREIVDYYAVRRAS